MPKHEMCAALQWGSYQIRKTVGYACARNAWNVFPPGRLQRKLPVSIVGMHHGTCVTCHDACRGRLLWWRGNVPSIPGTSATEILRIWQEAHCQTILALSALCLPFPTGPLVHDDLTWNRHSSALLVLCDRNPPATGGFPHKGTVTQLWNFPWC